MPIGFRYLLLRPDGEHADPAAFVTATAEWSAGDNFQAGDGSRWRVVSTEPNESAATDFDAIWTVEPLD